MTSVIELAPAKPIGRTSRAFQGLERVVVPALLIAGWEAFARSGYLPPALLPRQARYCTRWATGSSASTRRRRPIPVNGRAMRSLARFAFLAALRWHAYLEYSQASRSAGRASSKRPLSRRCRCCGRYRRYPGSARDHLVWNRQQAGDFPGVSRGFLSGADEYRSWREDGGPQSGARRRNDGRHRTATADKHCFSRGFTVDIRGPANCDWLRMDVDRHG